MGTAILHKPQVWVGGRRQGAFQADAAGAAFLVMGHQIGLGPTQHVGGMTGQIFHRRPGRPFLRVVSRPFRHEVAAGRTIGEANRFVSPAPPHRQAKSKAPYLAVPVLVFFKIGVFVLLEHATGQPIEAQIIPSLVNPLLCIGDADGGEG